MNDSESQQFAAGPVAVIPGLRMKAPSFRWEPWRPEESRAHERSSTARDPSSLRALGMTVVGLVASCLLVGAAFAQDAGQPAREQSGEQSTREDSTRDRDGEGRDRDREGGNREGREGRRSRRFDRRDGPTEAQPATAQPTAQPATTQPPAAPGSASQPSASTSSGSFSNQPARLGDMDPKYRLLLERSMFARSGNAARSDGPATRTTQPAPSLTPEQAIVLIGVLAQDTEFVAFTENRTTGLIGTLRSGDDVAGGKVAVITLDSLAFVTHGAVREISLGQNLAGETVGSGFLSTSQPSSTASSTTSGGTPSTLSPAQQALEERLRARRRGE